MTTVKKKPKVLIAEADKVQAAELKRSIERYCSDFSCKVCHSGDQVNSKVERYKSDILIMNLMLPVFDGLAVLDRLKREESSLSLIIILSPISKDVFVKAAISRGADYCIVTPISPEELAKRLMFLYEVAVTGPESIGEYTTDVSQTASSPSSVRETLKKDGLLIPEYRKNIRKLLSTIGIPAKVKGFSFLEEAVVMTLEDRCAVNNVTKVIYPIISRRFNSSSATVERGIRTAIDIAWSKPGGPKLMKKQFSFAPGEFSKKPTNAELIALLADKITVDEA